MIFSATNDRARRLIKEQGTRNIEVRSLCQATDLTWHQYGIAKIQIKVRGVFKGEFVKHFASNQLVLVVKSCLPGVCMREDAWKRNTGGGGKRHSAEGREAYRSAAKIPPYARHL